MGYKINNNNLFNFMGRKRKKNCDREIQHGGLNAPDIESIFVGLKSYWVERKSADKDKEHQAFLHETSI